MIDIVGGMFGAFGTVLALKQRDRTGKGGLVESALFESVVFLMGQHPRHHRDQRHGATADARACEFVGGLRDLQHVRRAAGFHRHHQRRPVEKRFCEFFKQAELAADPRLATNNLRIEARPWLVPKVAEVFKTYTKAALEQMCLDADISFAPVARPQDLFDHPHLLANGSLAPTTLPGGVKTRLPLLPFQMFGWRPPLVTDPPRSASTMTRCWRRIGYDKAGVAALKSAGILGPKG